MLSKEQAQEIKKQLITQVKNLPNENKEEIKNQINNFDEEQLEAFLKQNNIQITKKNQLSQESQENPSECIFCSITQNKIPSYKLTENKKAIAILEINPLSRGHSIILPLEHLSIEKLPKQILNLAQKIAKKIKIKLKPEDVKIETSSFQGHAMVNVIPIYKDLPLKKEQAEEKDLKKLQSKLETKKRASRTQKKEKTSNKTKQTTKSSSTSNLPEISFRIP